MAIPLKKIKICIEHKNIQIKIMFFIIQKKKLNSSFNFMYNIKTVVPSVKEIVIFQLIASRNHMFAEVALNSEN